jgi:thymidylate kinase
MENLETQLKVREVYLKYVEHGELVRVDGNKSKREAARDVASLVKDYLKKAR